METDTSFTSAVVRIKVVGVGGGGNSVVARLAQDRMPGVELIAVNTDAKQLGVLQAAGVLRFRSARDLRRGAAPAAIRSWGRRQPLRMKTGCGLLCVMRIWSSSRLVWVAAWAQAQPRWWLGAFGNSISCLLAW